MKYYNKKTWNDRWIVEEVFKGRRDGFFVEAGAQGGKDGSCTFVLETQFGWTGVLVEPLAQYSGELRRNRPESVCFEKCLSSRSGPVEFVEYPDRIGRSGIASFLPTGTRESSTGQESVVNVLDAVTLCGILQSVRAPRKIDYLALDIEGAEHEVLRFFPFEEYIFKAISLESAYRCKALLRRHGYRQVDNPFSEVNHEDYFVHRSCVETVYAV